MPVNVIRARLNSLRRNLPPREVEQSVVDGFNAMVDELEEELPDPEISHFKVKAADVKPLLIQVIPGQGAKYTKDKYCDPRIFKTQVEGLWEYLVDSGVVKADEPEPKHKTQHSQDVHFHAPVSGSVIQQGSYNTATVNYQNDVRQVIEEVRSVLNAAKLAPDAKDELRAEVETVEA